MTDQRRPIDDFSIELTALLERSATRPEAQAIADSIRGLIDSSLAPAHMKALVAIMVAAECARISNMSGPAAQLLARVFVKRAADQQGILGKSRLTVPSRIAGRDLFALRISMLKALGREPLDPEMEEPDGEGP